MSAIQFRTLGTLDLRAAGGREVFRLLNPGAPDTLVVVENWFEELKKSRK